ncbi:hypothetical protein J2W28_001034 [Variovorax boronicumulans]|uniref:hypothetical protein n=1 Tax=Variovorax boronicumulans TaxID=436515 RepID=UPI002787ADBA|nr:hypothetical protein [Variovorax boronicumulans]MDP9992006.1 hypothetical protein [Variovorax boronicumulans]MDQ0001901.1 hypothetical protein [Variovorax boronicumulans]
MLSPPGRAGERAADLAKQLGLTAGETMPSYGWGKPAVMGAVDGTATALKAYGGRWSAKDKALVFGSWAELEGVLAAILKERAAPST